jgi:hypothetical protein
MDRMVKKLKKKKKRPIIEEEQQTMKLPGTGMRDMLKAAYGPSGKLGVR